jgi:HEAT repeat protein
MVKTFSTPTGRRALEIILGEENVRAAVDHWISQKPGCFTAEMVLSIIRSKVAMERCYEIYKTAQDTEKAYAVFLLASIADVDVLPWVREFLDDENQGIRWNGLVALRTIVGGPLGDAAIATAKQLLDKAESGSDPEMRQRAKQIRSQLAMDHEGLRTNPI